MFSLDSSALVFILVCLVSCILIHRVFMTKGLPPLPPGPKSLPFIGNVRDMPASHEWLRFTDWSKSYGEVVSVNLFGKTLVILNSVQSARDLLDTRSAIYSCRPRFPMISELMGWDWAVQFMPYGHRFKIYRKSVQNSLTQQAVFRYRSAIEYNAIGLINAIASHPEAFLEHISHTVSNLMISIIYGIEDDRHRVRYIRNADKAIEGLIAAGNVGTFLVDIIPALKYVPQWFPCALFRHKAQVWRMLARDMIDMPYNHVHDLRRLGSAPPSVVQGMISEMGDEVDHDLIKGTAGVLYLGGADTICISFYSFMQGFLSQISNYPFSIHLMLLHSDIQKHAQAEIDMVIGKGRQPSLEDRQSLPYLNCVYLETLRWYPAVPLGVPHRVTQADFYNGYQIPCGASVVVNQWAIFRNESNYKEAHKFMPERFLYQGNPSNAVLDPRSVAFGFGRRKCPGRLLAEDATWLIMVSILARFNIVYAKNERGEPIIPELSYCSSLISRPEPFQVNFELRV